MAKKKTKKKVEELQDKKEYGPEKILDQRLVKGQIQYLVKWKGYLEEESSWEPGENLQCPDLIEDFLKFQVTDHEKDELKQGRGKAGLRNIGKREESKPKTKKEKSKMPEELEAEMILDAEKTSEGLQLLVKWKNCDKANLVPAKEANIKWPQLVIKFYEERLTWKVKEQE